MTLMLTMRTTAVSRIEEDLDAQPQDRDVKKKKGTQPKKYYKQLSKDVKDKEQTSLKNKIQQMIHHHLTKQQQ